MQLTETDIKKIKYEKRMAFVFSSLLLLFGGFCNLVYIVLSQDKSWILLFVGDFCLIGLCSLIIHVMNRKYNYDLQTGLKTIKLEKVQRKECETSYEAGSGSMHVPILGSLFPKIWGQEMKPSLKYNLIINGFRYEVSKEIFEKVNENEFVEMQFAKHSDTLLGIEIHKD